MKWGIAKRKDLFDSSIDVFKRNFDRVFDDFFSLRPSTLGESNWIPNLDVVEDEKAVIVKAELPGMSEKDINVTLDSNMLTISGMKNIETKEESKECNCIVSERRFGSFSRSIHVPGEVKADKIKASFKDGVLNVELPKLEKSNSKKINIEVK